MEARWRWELPVAITIASAMLVFPVRSITTGSIALSSSSDVSMRWRMS
jgi:hypothetical protein